MFMVIPTWEVWIKSSGPVFRVPESELDAFLRVLTFNQQEFDVRHEREAADRQDS